MDMDAVGYTKPQARHFMVRIKINKNKCWKTCPWLPTKAPSMLESLLNHEVSRQHIKLWHPQKLFMSTDSTAGLFIWSSWASAGAGTTRDHPSPLGWWCPRSTLGFCSCRCWHETLMAQHHFFPNNTMCCGLLDCLEWHQQSYWLKGGNCGINILPHPIRRCKTSLLLVWSQQAWERAEYWWNVFKKVKVFTQMAFNLRDLFSLKQLTQKKKGIVFQIKYHFNILSKISTKVF